LLSCVRPDRISSPMISTAALTGASLGILERPLEGGAIGKPSVETSSIPFYRFAARLRDYFKGLRST
jgi:hypothetical protein